MSDRKMVKWQPFDSVFKSKNVVDEIIFEKNKINMPVLSEDDFFEIDNNIKLAFNNNLVVNIFYFSDGFIKDVTCKIKKIDVYQKKIFLSNNMIIDFSKITKITL